MAGREILRAERLIALRRIMRRSMLAWRAVLNPGLFPRNASANYILKPKIYFSFPSLSYILRVNPPLSDLHCNLKFFNTGLANET